MEIMDKSIIQFYCSSQVVANRLEYVLVLEDDIRFESDFNRKMRNLLIEAKELLWNVKWDLM